MGPKTLAAPKFIIPLILPRGLASHMHAQMCLVIQGGLEVPGESQLPFKRLTLQHPVLLLCVRKCWSSLVEWSCVLLGAVSADVLLCKKSNE